MITHFLSMIPDFLRFLCNEDGMLGIGIHLGLGAGAGGSAVPDNAVVNRDGAFVINRDGAYVIADPAART